MTTLHTFTMDETQAAAIHQLAKGHIYALKNWMATAVEKGDLEKAQELCKELRKHEAIFAAFNMEAKHDIAKYSGKPLETNHVVAAV